MAVDALHDAELTLIEAGVDPSVLRHAIAEVRRRWAGQVYIRSNDPMLDVEVKRRLEAGEHPAEIARATGLHRTTIIRRVRSTWF